MVFSSEHLQSRLTSIKELERLKTILFNFGISDISVIVYLRRPAELANSLYATAIRSGSLLTSPPPPKDNYFNNICNHKNTIERFASVFGPESIVPRIFRKNDFINESIINDINYIIGNKCIDEYTIPSDANRSISKLGLKILRNINKKIPVFIKNKPNPLRMDVVNYVDKYFSDEKYIIQSSLYIDYDIEFISSDTWVRDNYFPHKEDIFSREIPLKNKKIIQENLILKK
ncbi:MAG: hypothetical protein CSA21_03060 [Deltaproteobacteria bacterium]|nr:MAG: hypothetical protein CSA21_03060 [Deltaproteobacteria bacterium]